VLSHESDFGDNVFFLFTGRVLKKSDVTIAAAEWKRPFSYRLCYIITIRIIEINQINGPVASRRFLEKGD
jgi:hypothetical protein